MVAGFALRNELGFKACITTTECLKGLRVLEIGKPNGKLHFETLESPSGSLHSIPSCKCTSLLDRLPYLASPNNGQGQGQLKVTLTADEGYDQSFLLTGPLTVKRSNGPMPTPAERPSRPSLEDACQYSTAITAQSTLDCRTARAAARHRDNNNCCTLPEKRYSQDGDFIWMDVAHIMPEASNKSIEGESQKLGVRTMSSFFTDVDILLGREGIPIHHVSAAIVPPPLRCALPVA
ncbi:hypothetical protein EV401DRAFT_135505 [Pisolithus croceorrhizus]|nr:hypothetical protein EV401DRAFT_135505 [Pisolithus croceorrhizus]